MLRKLAATGVAAATLLAAPLALAQDKGAFGQQGDFIFGVDRVFNLFSYTSNVYGTAAGNLTVNGTSMSLLWGGTSVSGGSPQGAGGFFPYAGNPNFYSAPRVGVDYVLIPHLTLGGEVFAWFTLGGSTSNPNGNGVSTNVSAPTGNEFGLAPRVGYVIDLNSVLSIWLRGGLHYYLSNWSSPSTNSNCNNGASLDVFGLDLDPQLVISPLPHLAFLAGPTLDWGFTGGWSTNTPDATCRVTTNVSGNYNAVNFSLNAGLIGWL